MEKDIEEMAKDEKLVEKIRKEKQEKNLKRLADRKQKLKGVFLSLFFLGVGIVVSSIIIA